MATYKGLITVDQLFREVGSPSQDPDSDTFFPKSATGHGGIAAGLESIITRHIEQFESEIERHLNDVGPKVVAHLSDEYVIRVLKDYTTPGIAGFTLPDDVIAYVYRAVLNDRTQLDYDPDLDRFVGRAIPGVEYHKIRLSGRDIEVLPNAEAAIYCYLVPKTRALEGVFPHLIDDINAAILKEARDAVKSGIMLRNQFRKQEREVAP